MAGLTKSKYTAHCVVCECDLPEGTPIWFEGKRAWCLAHGERPEVGLPSVDDGTLRELIIEVQTLARGVKTDLEAVRTKLDTLIAQGAK